MPELGQDTINSLKRKSDDGGVMKALLPWVLGVVTMLATAAFSFAWKTSQDVAVIKTQLSAQAVNPVDFGKLQVKVDNLEEKGKEIHENHKESLDQLRTWMRNHTHGGSVRPPDEPPPAAAAVPHP